MTQSDQIDKICQRLLENDEVAIDAFISELQQAGASLIGTMRMLIEKLQIGLSESRNLVLNSTAWAIHKESFFEFNSQMMDVLCKDADIVEEDGDKITLHFDLIKGKCSKDVQ